MATQLGVVMDPIHTINTKKDSTFAMLLAAQARGWTLWYMEMADLWLDGEQAYSRRRRVSVTDRATDWFTLEPPQTGPLAELDCILMRKDPPIDTDYYYATYILQKAHEQGVLVANQPDSLRDANEKLLTAWFPDCCVPSVVSADMGRLQQFLDDHGDIILKPLGAMGGASIFRVRRDDPNKQVIFETLTAHGRHYAMAQAYIPEIRAGDKRILLIDGEPVPYALARLPAAGETRANLAAGGRGEGRPLTDRDRWICAQVAPRLQAMGLLFVGLDVIGDYLTEINVTSPTCIRELDAQYDLDIAGQLMDCIAARLSAA